MSMIWEKTQRLKDIFMTTLFKLQAWLILFEKKPCVKKVISSKRIKFGMQAIFTTCKYADSMESVRICVMIVNSKGH